MTTMGVTVYCNRVQINGDQEQLMLLRTLQDNESNILGNQTHLIVQKPINNNSNINANNNSVLPPYDPSRLKKHGKNGQPPPVAVAKRNARERNRVKQVNNGFATLRQHIPNHIAAGYGDRGKKLSKVETLRMAVEYIRGLQRLLAEADGVEYDPNASIGNNVPSPSSSIISSTHNGSGERFGLEDDGNNDEDDNEHQQEDEEDDKRNLLITRLSPNPLTTSMSPNDYYSQSTGDEENLEPGSLQRTSNLNQAFSRLSPTSLASPQTEYYTQNEENLEPRLVVSPYSGAGDSEEGGTIYAASPEAFSGALSYYKQEISETGERQHQQHQQQQFMDVMGWWEQELVPHPAQSHAQRLAHV